MFFFLALIRSQRSLESVTNSDCDNQRRILEGGKLNLEGCDFNMMKFDDECPKNEHTKLYNDAKFVNCTFTDINEIAKDGQAGGAIQVLQNALTLVGCKFIRCSISKPSYADAGNGGGIYLSNSYNYFTDCVFESCSADYSGGAIYCVDCKGSINKNCTIYNCTNNGRMKGSGVTIGYEMIIGMSPIIEFIKVKFDHCYHTSNEVKLLIEPCMLHLAAFMNNIRINATIIDCEFINTHDFAVFCQPSYLTVKSTLFEKIVTTYNNLAACIHCNADKIDKGDYLFTNITFANCQTDDFGVVNVPNVKFVMR